MEIIQLYQTLNEVIPNWLNYSEPETIEILLKSKGVDVPDDVSNMINALKTCLTIETPWISPHVFENVVDAFSGNIVIPETLTLPPLEDIITTVDIMMNIREFPFSAEIGKYIATVAVKEGLLALPDPIAFANEFIPNDTYGLKDEMLKRVEGIANIPVDYPYNETPVEIQLAKLSALWSEYVRRTGHA